MSSAAKVELVEPLSDRLLSIDALRGFDMFWIMGAEDIVREFARWGNWPGREWIEEQLDHAPWAGFHFYDLIFPLFLFLVGAVLPFSLGKLRERGAPTSALYWRIFRRTLLLLVLGVFYNNYGHVAQLNDIHELRLVGVLQRIGLCYFFAALVVMNTRALGQVLITLALLLGYWALLANVAPPGGVPPDYSKEGNLPGYVDAHWLPGKIPEQYYGYGDNEGILSTIPAVATALLGVLAGNWLRTQRASSIKVLGLALAGAICLATGTVWGESFPVIKNIWTSSFVLVAGGWSLLLLAIFYWIIDVLRFRAWTFFFVVIGVNAITIYLLPHVVDFRKVVHFFFGALIDRAGSFQTVLEPIVVFAVEWLVLLYLYRKRLFIRV
jgi:predicted acyltransferase